MQQDDQKSRTCGWVTERKKDGYQTLSEPFYATNPAYVAVHKEWDWQECDFAIADREVKRSLGINPSNGDAA